MVSRTFFHASRVTVLLAAVLVTGIVVPRPTTAAAAVPWGTVLVPGSTWAGAEASRGDLNVYSNGTGSQDQSGPYGLDYECVELAVRWAAIAFGDEPSAWNVFDAAQMWGAGPHLPIPFLQHPNGGADMPQFGDIIVFNSTSYDPTGHVAVVAGVGGGYVNIVEQNWGDPSPTGVASLPIQGTYMPPRWGLTIDGWLRAATAPNGWANSGPGGYTTDTTGHVYPWGSASFPSEPALWPSNSPLTATGIARIPNSDQGWVLDDDGNLHPFGGAPRYGITASFSNGIARAVQLDASSKGGWVLDGYGYLHPFGDAVAITDYSATWPGYDIARDFVLLPKSNAGYILDGFGGIHPFGGAPPIKGNTGYQANQDVARGLCLRTDLTSGWWVDGANDLHGFGGAPVETSSADFPGQDVARGIVCDANDDGGYTTTDYGKVRNFGVAPQVAVATTLSSPLVEAMAS